MQQHHETHEVAHHEAHKPAGAQEVQAQHEVLPEGEPLQALELAGHSCFIPKCVDCIGELLAWQKAHPMGQMPGDPPAPEVGDAVTFAPAWQIKTMMGQQIMACIAVPACMRHLGVTENSPIEQAVLGGKLIPGGRGTNN